MRKFFEQYNLNGFPIGEKYKTVAADYYKRRIYTIANQKSFDKEEPTVEEGAKQLEEDSKCVNLSA